MLSFAMWSNIINCFSNPRKNLNFLNYSLKAKRAKIHDKLTIRKLNYFLENRAITRPILLKTRSLERLRVIYFDAWRDIRLHRIYATKSSFTLRKKFFFQFYLSNFFFTPACFSWKSKSGKLKRVWIRASLLHLYIDRSLKKKG